MAFSVARVHVWDVEARNTVVSQKIKDPSEIKKLINMKRSYKKDPDTNRDVSTTYQYSITLVRDGCEFKAKYSDPNDIEVSATDADPFGASIVARLSYKKATGDLHIKRLNIVFGANSYAAPLTHEEIEGQLTRALAMFSYVRDIAPVVVGDKLKPTYKVADKSAASGDWHDNAPDYNMTTRDFAAYKAAVKKQLADFNIVAKL